MNQYSYDNMDPCDTFVYGISKTIEDRMLDEDYNEIKSKEFCDYIMQRYKDRSEKLRLIDLENMKKTA